MPNLTCNFHLMPAMETKCNFQAEQNSDSDDWEPPEDMPPVQPKPSKKELAAEKKKQAAPKAKAGRGGKQNAAPQQMSDLLPQHFTAAGGKGSPKTKMARIPKITERVSLPTPDSLGLAGMQVSSHLFLCGTLLT